MVGLVVVDRDERMRVRVDEPRQQRRVAEVERLEARCQQLRATDGDDPLAFDHDHRVPPDLLAPPVDQPRRADGEAGRGCRQGLGVGSGGGREEGESQRQEGCGANVPRMQSSRHRHGSLRPACQKEGLNSVFLQRERRIEPWIEGQARRRCVRFAPRRILQFTYGKCGSWNLEGGLRRMRTSAATTHRLSDPLPQEATGWSLRVCADDGLPPLEGPGASWFLDRQPAATRRSIPAHRSRSTRSPTTVSRVRSRHPFDHRRDGRPAESLARHLDATRGRR